MQHRLRTLLILITGVGILFAYWQWSAVSTEGLLTSKGHLVRIYHSEWKRTFFKPAAALESVFTGVHVSARLMLSGEENEQHLAIEIPEP